MRISAKQIEAVTSLSGKKRYEHFVKVITDKEVAWGLYKDGWAMSETDSGEKIFPIWPEREYAEMCASGPWSGFEAEAFPLDDLLNELIPNLTQDNMLLGVFYTKEDRGVTPTNDEFVNDVMRELERY